MSLPCCGISHQVSNDDSIFPRGDETTWHRDYNYLCWMRWACADLRATLCGQRLPNFSVTDSQCASSSFRPDGHRLWYL
eukprot:4608003-Amphidinium_carterae.1